MSSKETIEHFMTASPHTIGSDQSAGRAHALLREHDVRHLPVLRGGEVVGIISNRDLQFIFVLEDAKELPVDDVMSPDVYTVTRDTPVREVVQEMAAQKIGSAVVMDGNKVAGIFTTTDALTALLERL